MKYDKLQGLRKTKKNMCFVKKSHDDKKIHLVIDAKSSSPIGHLEAFNIALNYALLQMNFQGTVTVRNNGSGSVEIIVESVAEK